MAGSIRQLPLDLRVETGTAKRLDPRATVVAWADLAAADLRKLSEALHAMGWHHATISHTSTQLDVTGPSGIRITLWHGLERSTVMAQLSLGWLGPIGVIVE